MSRSRVHITMQQRQQQVRPHAHLVVVCSRFRVAQRRKERSGYRRTPIKYPFASHESRWHPQLLPALFILDPCAGSVLPPPGRRNVDMRPCMYGFQPPPKTPPTDSQPQARGTTNQDGVLSPWPLPEGENTPRPPNPSGIDSRSTPSATLGGKCWDSGRPLCSALAPMARTTATRRRRVREGGSGRRWWRRGRRTRGAWRGWMWPGISETWGAFRA